MGERQKKKLDITQKYGKLATKPEMNQSESFCRQPTHGSSFHDHLHHNTARLCACFFAVEDDSLLEKKNLGAQVPSLKHQRKCFVIRVIRESVILPESIKHEH